MATMNITDENFDTEVLKSDKPIVVDFWAEWCGPCKQIGPTLEEISNEMSNEVTIAKHNIDEEPNTPTKYGVRGRWRPNLYWLGRPVFWNTYYVII